MGFTLRAAQATAPPDARFIVAEIVPKLIEWAGQHMAAVFGDCLSDPRVEVKTCDVGALIGEAEGAFDAILLDVDNGPDGLSAAPRHRDRAEPWPQDWLPALEGVTQRLASGGAVADIGCGHGQSSRPGPSPMRGSSGLTCTRPRSRRRAGMPGLGDVRFEVGSAQDFAVGDFYLVTCFDALHDMGDPAGAARCIRQALAPGGGTPG
jgi:hypothetical protein